MHHKTTSYPEMRKEIVQKINERYWYMVYVKSSGILSKINNFETTANFETLLRQMYVHGANIARGNITAFC